MKSGRFECRLVVPVRVAICGLLIPGVAWAQKPGNVPNEDGGLIQWAVAAGVALVVCLSAFLNPKRSHLN